MPRFAGHPYINKFIITSTREKTNEIERKIWQPSWVYTGIRRLCSGSWKCVEVSLYDREIWGRRIYYHLSDFSNLNGLAHYGL